MAENKVVYPIQLELWPVIKPFDEGLLVVNSIHSIHYALYGNPKGKPVFFLHGGPGGGCTDDDARWFDPNKFLIVLLDQRGSGKSTPLAEIKDNTTQDLINDIERLHKHLIIKIPFSIFAGSWGSTLALLYAEQYPKNVLRMILRGIFTCSHSEQDYFYSESGAAKYFPEPWNKLIKNIPQGNDRLQNRIHIMLENSAEEDKLKLMRILAEYEYSFFNLLPHELEKELSNIKTVYPEMRLNMHYQANRFFLEDEQIIRNIDPIKHMPVTIIHGSNDRICPPSSALKLHKHLPKSELIIVEGAGHISSDLKITQALLKALESWD